LAIGFALNAMPKMITFNSDALPAVKVCNLPYDWIRSQVGEKNERCTIQSPKPIRSSSNNMNSWAAQAKGSPSHPSNTLPSANSKPNLAASAASPNNTSKSGGLSRSGGLKNSEQPSKASSMKAGVTRHEDTVEIKRTLGDVLKSSKSKSKLDPSVNAVSHYCKWDWLYCKYAFIWLCYFARLFAFCIL
jgi:hypothetical protein